jgi:hypothetical protein
MDGMGWKLNATAKGGVSGESNWLDSMSIEEFEEEMNKRGA